MEKVLEQSHTNSGSQSVSDPKAGRDKLLATGSVIGALLASSCCIAPLILVSLGISSTWIGSLTALEPYNLIFLTVTGAILATGFWHVYIKPKPPCENGSYCAQPMSGWVVKSALWIATVIATLSSTVNYWAPLFY